jgi:hypothetical protein
VLAPVVVDQRRLVYWRRFGVRRVLCCLRLGSGPTRKRLIDVKAIIEVRRERIDCLGLPRGSFRLRPLLAGELFLALRNLFEFLRPRVTSLRLSLQAFGLGPLVRNRLSRLLGAPFRLLGAGELPFSLEPEALSLTLLAIALKLAPFSNGHRGQDDEYERTANHQNPEPRRHAVRLPRSQARKHLRRAQAVTDCWTEPLEDDGTIVVLCVA